MNLFKIKQLPGQPRGGLPLLLPAIVSAAVAWFFLFAVPGTPFWPTIAGATLLLGIIGANTAYPDSLRESLRAWAGFILVGVVSAAALYLIFATGNRLAQLLPFGREQVGLVYGAKSQASEPLIAALLLFAVGPGEELFWRAWVQRALMNRLGPWRGMLLTLALYAGVHLPSLNLTLIAAATVAGTFWGLLYLRMGHVGPGIISHALWDAAVFIWFPFT